jgi:hypothetical protein
VLHDLQITPHRPLATASNGSFAFPPEPIFLHTGDTLSAVVRVRVAGAGSARAARIITYGTGSITATHDGPAQVTVHATPAGKRALRRKGQLAVSLHLAFRSAARLGSTSTSKDFRVKLKKKH